MPLSRGRGASALVLLVIVSLAFVATSIVPSVPRTDAGVPALRTSATLLAPRAYYLDSQYLEINWTRTQDACFRSYTFNFSANPASWTTSFQGTDANDTSVQIVGLAAGNTYYWEVTDTDCGGNSLTTPIYVVTMPFAGHLSLSYINDTAVHLYWQNNFTYGGQGNLSFLWNTVYYVPRGAPPVAIDRITNLADRNYTFNAPSLVEYSLYVITSDTCTICNPMVPLDSQSNSVTFTAVAPVTSIPSATPSTTDVGVSVAFSCTAAHGAGPFAYAWDFGDGSSATTANETHTYASAGIKTATCTVTDAHNATDHASVSVHVDPAPTVTSNQSATQVAPGSAIIFTATPTGGNGGPYTITWNFGDGTSGTGTTATHTYPTAGTYVPTVTVTDSLGGTTTHTLSAITVGTPGGVGDLALFAGIGVIVVVAVLAVAFLMMRKRKRGPSSPPGAQPPQNP